MAYSKNRRLAEIVSDTAGNLSVEGIVVPTQSNSDNDTSAASTAFVHAHVNALVDSAPGTLNTLNELASALNDQDNFGSTITTAVNAKLPLAGGTLTGALTTNGVINTGTSHNFAINTPNSLRINIDSNDSATDQVFVIGKNQTAVDASNDVLFKIGEDGNVGIGTASPDLKLHIDGVNAYPATSGTTPNGMLHLRAKTAGGTHGLYMGVANASPYGSWLQAADSGNLATEYPLLLNPNGGNVGIGTTSVSASRMQIKGANNSTSAYADGLKVTSNNETVYMQYSWTGMNANDSMKFGTAGSERMRIDSEGNVLIGKTTHNVNNTQGVDITTEGAVVATNDSGISFLGNRTGSDGEIMLLRKDNVTTGSLGTSGTSMTFGTGTNGAEKMRINSSGTLLVGTTDDAHYGGSSNSGFVVTNGGITGISRDSGTVLYLNRQTNDGDIITFRKNGSLMGHAGTYGGAFYVGGSTNGSNGSGLMFNGVDIEPTTGSTGRTDGAIDLGSSNFRFQHLRFSGGLYGGSELQLSRVGVGTAAGSSVAVNSSNVEGIHWHNSTGDYYMGRTPGSWTGPNYQQFKLNWDTGIILDGGTAYGKSGVHLKGPVASSHGGMVLQTLEAYNSTAISTSGSGVTVVQSATFPILQGSRILVHFNSGQVLNPGNASNPNFNIQWVNSSGTSTVISDQNSNHYWYDMGKNSGARVFMTGQAISPALNADTYSIQVIGNVYNGSATWNYQSQGAHIIIQEISEDL